MRERLSRFVRNINTRRRELLSGRSAGGLIRMRFRIASFVGLLGFAVCCGAQSMPGTAGETLSGKRLVPADAVRGHAAILVAGFSHDGGMQCGPWMKAIYGDAALTGVAAYELAM